MNLACFKSVLLLCSPVQLTKLTEISPSKQIVMLMFAIGIDSMGNQSLAALATQWVWLRVEGPLIGRSLLL